MIRPSDAVLLAVTKLHTRRIRTFITVVTAGLLFGVLIAILVVAQGASKSIDSFNKEGLNDRYIAEAIPDSPFSTGLLETTSIQTRAQDIYNQTIVDKKAAAKTLGITYDPTAEISPIGTFGATSGQAQHTYLSLISPSAQQALREWIDAHPAPGLPQLKQLAASHHPTGFYATTTLGGGDGLLVTMEDGQESFDQNSQLSNAQYQKDILESGGLEIASPALTTPFLLPNTAKNVDPNAVPILVPYSKAQSLLGLSTLPKSASPDQRLARIRELYTKANAIMIEGCYRNGVSEEQISTAVSQAADIAKNVGNKDYQKPDLIYGLPTADSCGAAPILSDTRTKAEKQLAAKQDTFTKEFGGVIDPIQQKIPFHVVGLIPDGQGGGSSTTIAGLLQGIVGSSLGGVVAIPGDQFDQMPDAAELKTLLFPTTSLYGTSATSYYVEFPNATTARKFITDRTCTNRVDGTCSTNAKPFQLIAFGSNSIALQDLQHKFSRVFKITALVVVGLAIIILTGTIGRMIADGRRETAVFRANGAKRVDIALIYGTYTFLLSCLVAVAALVLGLVVAYVFDGHYWRSTTVQAQLLFGASNIGRVFHFFSVNTAQVGLVLLAVIAAGFASMLFPIIRNVRRNPIKDMREE